MIVNVRYATATPNSAFIIYQKFILRKFQKALTVQCCGEYFPNSIIIDNFTLDKAGSKGVLYFGPTTCSFQKNTKVM